MAVRGQIAEWIGGGIRREEVGERLGRSLRRGKHLEEEKAKEKASWPKNRRPIVWANDNWWAAGDEGWGGWGLEEWRMAGCVLPTDALRRRDRRTGTGNAGNGGREGLAGRGQTHAGEIGEGEWANEQWKRGTHKHNNDTIL